MNTPYKSPSFSIILAVQDQAETLQNELPALLTQQYDEFQIVVVDESSADNTLDVLNNLKEQYPHLYGTFVPKYHFQRNIRRLAFTIGIKAAKGEWIIFADIDRIPHSDTWISELAEFSVRSNELLLGYVKRKTGDVRLKTYEELSLARGVVTKTEHRRVSGGHSWSRFLHHDYDFIAVRADKGHELLKLFELSKPIRL